MVWCLFATACAFAMANAPLLYCLLRSHGPNLVGKLWGYSPQQFFFCLFIFPFGALATFWALTTLLTEVGPLVNETAPIRPLYDHWVLCPLAAMALACILTGLDYWSSARSLDKLRPEYSRLALSTLEDLHDQVSATPATGRDELLREFSRNATQALKVPPKSSTKVAEWLQAQNAPQRLGVLLDADLQRKLSLLEPNLYVISLFQVAATVGVGITLMFVALIGFSTHAQAAYMSGGAESLGKVLNLCSLGVVAFGLYAICYQQYRLQISELVGKYSSTNPHYFVAFAVIAVLLTLSLANPEKSVSLVAVAARFGPLIALGSLTVVERTQQAAVRSLIGMDTNFGTQAMVAVTLGTFFSCLFAYSWSSLK
jgi:hypothetical protein